MNQNFPKPYEPKGYDNSFNSWIDKIFSVILLYKK